MVDLESSRSRRLYQHCFCCVDTRKNAPCRPTFGLLCIHWSLSKQPCSHIDLFVIVPLLFWLFNRDKQPSKHTACAGIGALIKPTILLAAGVDAASFTSKYSVGSLRSASLCILTLRIMGQARSGLISYFSQRLALWVITGHGHFLVRPSDTGCDSHRVLSLHQRPLDYPST